MQHFQKFLESQKKHSYIVEGDRIVVAFSGGPDSVFLVEMLLKLKQIFPFHFILVHLHHQIRGESAERDYEFCKYYAEQRGLEYIREKQDAVLYAKEHNKTLEEAGRILRYSLFAKVKQEKNYTKIATGHHLDDHLETFFFRLLRGSSMEGLAGIARKTEDKIRPLREFEKEEILSYLQEKGIPFCQDETNEEADYARNKLRLKLLPQLFEYNPKWKEKVNAFTEELADRKEEEFIDFEHYRDDLEPEKLNVTKLQKEKPYLQRKILYRYILSKQVFINRKQIDKIYTLFEKGGSLSYDLKKACKFKKEYDRIWIELEEESKAEDLKEKELEIPGITFFGNYKISTFLMEDKDLLSSYFCFSWKVGEKVILRTYRSGDRIQLPGLVSPKKVKEIFINKKIAKEKRKKVVILEYQGKILSLAGFVVAARDFCEEEKKVMVKIEEV